MKNKINFCMKASPFYLSQLQDKIERLNRLYEEGISLSKKAQIELHIVDLLNPEFWKKGVENCNSLSEEADFIMHAQCLLDPKISVKFAREINSKKVVIHRLYDIVTTSRKEATQKFNEEMISLAKDNPDITFCMENVGPFLLIAPEHAYLKYLVKKTYLTNPLNHFFPWEMKDFIKATKDIYNLGICFDTAHAAITCNIYNYMKKSGKHEERFSDITDDDLKKTNPLTVPDFLKAALPKLFYCHFNDAYLYKNGNFDDKYVLEEGMQIGDADINFSELVNSIDPKINWLVELSKVKNYNSAIEMEVACRKLSELYNNKN